MIPRWRRSWDDQTEDLPVDVLPCSNGEYIPPAADAASSGRSWRLADAETERWRRRLGHEPAPVRAHGGGDGHRPVGHRHGRRQPLRAASASPTTPTRPTPATSSTTARPGCETLQNLPGEFIFDVQSHHVDPDGLWRVNNPAIHAFFAAIWPQSSAAARRPARHP